MKGTTHLATGIGLGLVLGNLLAPPYDISSQTMLAISLGALMPDIDNEGMIAHVGKLLSIKNKTIREFFNSIGCAISKLIQSFTAHRGFFHWPIISILFISYGAFFNSPFSFFFGMGYLSHCLLDSLNTQGIPIFAPLTLKKYHIANLKYNGIGEKIFLIIFVLLIIWGIKTDLMIYLDQFKNTSY